VDLRSGFQITPNWAVALSVNNVLDKSYYESYSRFQQVWYGEPRNVMLRVDGRY
jgi:outer membrane receptor for ferric coprogen and ferric-rhodotorulic acid